MKDGSIDHSTWTTGRAVYTVPIPGKPGQGSLSFKELAEVRHGLISRKNDVCDNSEAEMINLKLVQKLIQLFKCDDNRAYYSMC